MISYYVEYCNQRDIRTSDVIPPVNCAELPNALEISHDTPNHLKKYFNFIIYRHRNYTNINQLNRTYFIIKYSTKKNCTTKIFR